VIKPLIIPIEVKKKCIQMTKDGKTVREVYTEYYSKEYTTAFEGFRKMLQKWKKKTFADDVLLDAGNLGYGYTPTRTTVQVNSQGEVVQTWIKSHTTDSMYMELIDNIKNMQPFESIQKKEMQPIDRMLEITFDDMHFGVATFEDYMDTLQDTIEIIKSHQYKEINMIIGEDLLHTDDLKGHTSNGTDIGKIDVPKAYNDTIRFYFALIEKSLENSERVRVTYSVGNHSETLSWTIVQVLKVKYPQAEYDDSLDNLRKVITYGKIFIGITHGDTIKGSLRDIKELFVEENTMAYALATIKEIHIGHYHVSKETGDINGCVVRRLSTKVPPDEWHKKKGFTMAVKRFMLFEYSSDKLLSIHYV
jgi:hypothetical protein